MSITRGLRVYRLVNVRNKKHANVCTCELVLKLAIVLSVFFLFHPSMFVAATTTRITAATTTTSTTALATRPITTTTAATTKTSTTVTTAVVTTTTLTTRTTATATNAAITTIAAATTTATKQISTATTTHSMTCPKCGTNKVSGRVSCCFPGGSWFRNCGDVSGSNMKHSWTEGFAVCKSEFALCVCVCVCVCVCDERPGS